MEKTVSVEAGSRQGHVVREIDKLPGPRGLPWVGNALQLHAGRVHLDIEAWARQFGTCFQFRIGPRRFLALADHEAIVAVLRDRPDGFRRSSRLEEITREMGLAPGVFVANGDTWRRQRRMVMAAFDPAHVKAYFPSLLNVAMRLNKRWQAAASAGTTIDLRADLMRYTVDGVSGLAFGSETNTLERDGDVIQAHLNRIFPTLYQRLLALVPYWRYFKLPSDRQLERGVRAVNTAVQEFIDAARERMRLDPALVDQPSNLLEAMIAAADRQGSGIDDQDIAGNVLTMLLAGEDTTANTLAWLIWLLHANPAAMARARDEIRRLAPDLSSIKPETVASLEYLEWCANEAMRLRPVAPTMLSEAIVDTTIGDIRVPAGTVLWLILRHDTVDKRYFPDPRSFDPLRWRHEGADGHESSKRIAMPFGAGARVCPGRYLALLEMKMAMIVLLGQFDVESVETTSGAEPQEYMALTMAPIGLRMKIRAARTTS